MWSTALLVLIPTAICVVLVVVIHRYLAPEGGWLRDMEDAGEIFSTVGTGLAVLIAFLIVAAFQHYSNARDAVGQEAVAVQQQYVMGSYFQEPDSDELRGEVICYGRSVVSDEWPAMRNGGSSVQVQGWVDNDGRVDAGGARHQPEAGRGARPLVRREQRSPGGPAGPLAEASPFVPGFLWAALILISMVVLGYQLLLVDPRVRVFGQAYSMAAMAVTVFAALAIVYMVDRPFNDRGAMIHPDRMESALSNMAPTAPATLPCDASGRPTTS